jgi:hypothetical protein
MKTNGMAAIVTVIILGSLMILIGGVMVLSAINKGQIALTDSQAKRVQTLLDSCAEESLLRINENNTLPSRIITNYGLCNVTVNSQIGNSWNLSIGTSGSALGVNVVLNRGSTISISNWADQ